MHIKSAIFAVLLFSVGQIIVWFQMNGPIIWPSLKQYNWLFLLIGVPITWLFMLATAAAVSAFDGQFWPARFLSFISGIVIFSCMTWLICNEAITWKSAVTLLLCGCILCVQLFWKH